MPLNSATRYAMSKDWPYSYIVIGIAWVYAAILAMRHNRDIQAPGEQMQMLERFVLTIRSSLLLTGMPEHSQSE